MKETESEALQLQRVSAPENCLRPRRVNRRDARAQDVFNRLQVRKPPRGCHAHQISDDG
jgi:hypothetical protein